MGLATAIEAIYDAALEPGRWPQALEASATCFGDIGAVLIYVRDDGRFGLITNPALAVAAKEYARDWSHRDIRSQRARERGYFIHREAITDRDLMAPGEMDSHPLFTDFLHRHGLRYFAGVTVSPDPHVEVALSIQRQRGRPAYSDAELGQVAVLGRHVERALRLGIRLMNAELINVGLGAALARIGVGVFAVDALDRIVFSNPAGEALLGDGIDAVNGRLRLHSTGSGAAALRGLPVAAAIAASLTGEPKPMLVERRRERRPLAVYVLPISDTVSAAHRFLADARAIVLVTDPEPGGPPDPALIRDVMGLTLGEARIAALIGSGLPPREAAARLGIAEDTARKALKQVFTKVGVSRQSELAALMTKLVLVSAAGSG